MGTRVVDWDERRTAGNPALSALTRKRAALVGEAGHLARQLDRLWAHLDAASRILCPDEARLELIKPRVLGQHGCN